ATGNLLKQRGAAENNQRARAVITMLDGDLSKRTYRQRNDCVTDPVYRSGAPDALANISNRLARGIVPLHPDYYIPGVGGLGRGVDAAKGRGYFYISENDPFNDADDVLQFTVDTTTTDLGDKDTTPLIRRAIALAPTCDIASGTPLNLDQPV